MTTFDQTFWQETINDPRLLAAALRRRCMIAYGAFAVIYRVGNVSFKVGCISEKEVMIQKFVATANLALPVIAYCEDAILPRIVTQEVCPWHGVLRHLWDRNSTFCHCGETLGILVMPLAKDANRVRVEQEGETLLQRLNDTTKGQPWHPIDDRHHRNFIEYEDQLLICDFGSPHEKLAEMW